MTRAFTSSDSGLPSNRIDIESISSTNRSASWVMRSSGAVTPIWFWIRRPFQGPSRSRKNCANEMSDGADLFEQIGTPLRVQEICGVPAGRFWQLYERYVDVLLAVGHDDHVGASRRRELRSSEADSGRAAEA
jgi:hypothetical protein